ncbi:ferredoxin [Nocardia jiangxiensis]|uniref:Ferredoxin n=1 Tax=Nocardia jiangxiensis TaxID=282685 RepID=A0ABW6S126_9NOCA|nr:ferredoxin [Nocardia jiangxiensis]
MADWTVRVDRSACLGCGVCLDYAPRSFAQDEDGQAVLREPPGDELDRVREAVSACPTGALQLVIGSDAE